MLISEAKEAFKICDVVIDNERPYALKPVYCDKFVNFRGYEHPKNIVKENVARTYFIVVNGEIKKIGGSSAENGMEGGTIPWYMTGWASNASKRTIGIWYLMYKELLLGKKVEIYMHYWKNIWYVNDDFLGETNEKETRLDPKEIEKRDLKSYKLKEGSYPPWNFQEQHKKWPQDVIDIEMEYKNGGDVKGLIGGLLTNITNNSII